MITEQRVRRLSTVQAAAELGVSAQTVRQLIQAGELPATVVGAGGERRHYRIAPHAIEMYVQRQRTGRRVTR